MGILWLYDIDLIFLMCLQFELIGYSVFDFIYLCDYEEMREMFIYRNGEKKVYCLI